MPQGVEHIGMELRYYHGPRVTTSLMPQGVEHEDLIQEGLMAGLRVTTSLMPQGVEHLAECGTDKNAFQ